ncbi:MAG: hypothetical protein M1834_007268 [Cirrosporium novae-zelandiae]|nr:MAG: hypothetical protein M1834_007268 [Cirrosporium novae-zelandiae]
MLQTCNRCRARRIKCDALLPACANCAKAQLLCTFKDDVLQENVPRSYVKSLYDRIEELKSLLSLEDHGPPEHSRHQGTINTFTLQKQSFYVPASKNGQYLYLGPSLPAINACAAVQALLALDNKIQAPSLQLEPDSNEDVLDFSKIDRSVVSTATVRLLLAHFDRNIRPSYPILPLSFVKEEECTLKTLPRLQRFHTLIACSIAAAHKSYREPNWRVIAKVCREWAGELATPIVSERDGEAFVALLLLLVYELADPDRGMLWEFLGFAIRTCLQLGWQRVEDEEAEGSAKSHDSFIIEGPGGNGFSDSRIRQLMTVLYSIERPVSMIFQKPTMLASSAFSNLYQQDTIFEIHKHISSELYESNKPYDTHPCPTQEPLSSLIASLSKLPAQNPLVLETWLLFLPLCIGHKPCRFCSLMQEGQSFTALQWLCTTMVSAAAQFLHGLHLQIAPSSGFVPPFMASTKAFTAGCIIVTGITSDWVDKAELVGALLECSEILISCSSLWKGGREFYRVWRSFVNAI